MYNGSRIITQKEKEELARKIKGRMEAFSRRTLGGPCPTPGRKIKSKGKGRGLARGGGRGPVGIPFFDR